MLRLAEAAVAVALWVVSWCLAVAFLILIVTRRISYVPPRR
jgi:hypothetical protein